MDSFSLYGCAYWFGKYPNSNKNLVGIVTFPSKGRSNISSAFCTFCIFNYYFRESLNDYAYW